jgi:phosphoribosylamine--glycine ligase
MTKSFKGDFQIKGSLNLILPFLREVVISIHGYEPMNILVLGNGGREHALAWKIAQDEKVAKVFVAPGNAGTATENKCENVALNILDNAAIIDFAKNNAVDLIIVGPEAPLVNGVVDACRAAELQIWGPTQFAAQLEGSKAFAKHFLKRHNIPTAFYDVFTEVDAAKAFVEKMARQS